MGRYKKSPSPSKNLTQQRPLPSIGTPIIFNRDGSLCLDDIFVQSYGSPENEIRFPRPIERIEIFEREKSVHFDDFVKIRSIDNTAVLKGRPVDPRRPRQASDPYRQKQAQVGPRTRNVERPRGADRGRRMQSVQKKEPPVREAHKERTVTSAPLTDREEVERRHQNEAPTLKLNTLMDKDKQAEKHEESSAPPRDTPIAETLSPNDTRETPSMTIETPSEKSTPDGGARETPKVETGTSDGRETEETPTNKGAVVDTGSQQDDQRRFNKLTPLPGTTWAQARARRHRAGTDKGSSLPSDDHGPVEIPSAQFDEETGSVSDKQSTSGDKNFKKKPEKPPPRDVPPLDLSPEPKPRPARMYDDLHLSSVSPSKSDKSQAVEPIITTTQSVGIDKHRKRREVTIIEPRETRDKRQTAEMQAQSKEYEYGHGDHHRREMKEFQDMTNDEKINYFITELKVKPEQIRELTFHPKVNEPKIIHNTYTGMSARDRVVAVSDRRGKSGRRPKHRTLVYRKVHTIAPHQRKSYMLSKLSGAVYRHINNVYGQSPRQTREKNFYERLARIQLEEYRQRYETLEEKEKKRLESLFRQREQLKQLRKRFEDDSWKRFMTQYVTSKVVDAEFKDSKQYGLPNVVTDELPSMSRKRELTMDPSRKQQTNRRKYNAIFNFNTGPSNHWKTKGKPMQFEGIDSVYLDTEDEEGRPTRKRQDVSELMKEAAMLIDNAELTDKEVPSYRRTQKPQPRPTLSEHKPERPKQLQTRSWRHRIERERTPRGVAKGQTKPPLRTMKDLISRRFATPKRLTRYQTSEFFKPPIDLTQTNKNNNAVEKPVHRTKTPNKVFLTEPEKQNQNHKRPAYDYKIPAHMYDMRTPPESPEPQRERSSPVSKTVVTKTTKEITVTETVTDNGQGIGRRLSKTESLQKPFEFLEEPETLIGTARKEEAEHMTAYYKNNHDRPKLLVSTRRESRTSVHVHDTPRINRSTASLRKSPVASRSPSKASVRPPNDIPQKENTLNRKYSQTSIYTKQETPRNVKTNATDNIRASRTSLQPKATQNPYKTEGTNAQSIRASRTSLQAPSKKHDNVTPRRASQSILMQTDRKDVPQTANELVNGEITAQKRSRSRSMSNERKQHTKELYDVYTEKTPRKNMSKDRNQPTPTRDMGETETRSRSKERVDNIKPHVRNKSKERNQPTPNRHNFAQEKSPDRSRSRRRSTERRESTSTQVSSNKVSVDKSRTTNKSLERNKLHASKESLVSGESTKQTRSRSKSRERKLSVKGSNQPTPTQHASSRESATDNNIRGRQRSKERKTNNVSDNGKEIEKSDIRKQSQERKGSTSSKGSLRSRSKSREGQKTQSTQLHINGESKVPINRKMSQALSNGEANGNMNNRNNIIDRKSHINTKQTIMNGELPTIGRKTSIVSTGTTSVSNSQFGRNKNEFAESRNVDDKPSRKYKGPVNAMYRKATDISLSTKKPVRPEATHPNRGGRDINKARKNEKNVSMQDAEYGPGGSKKNMQNSKKFEPIQARHSRPAPGKPKGQDDKRYKSKSVVPQDYTYMNGHENTYDTRVVRREEYERQAKDRKSRKRSYSGDRKRSTSRSTSRERRRSGSRTRKSTVAREIQRPSNRKPIKSTNNRESEQKVVFPDIVVKKMQKDMPHATTIKQKPQVTHTTRVDETVNERVVEPKKRRVPDTGSKWQDMVAKYIRQPSPKLGKTDDRSLLDLNYETDTTESEMDIFERARRRYELASTASSDSDDEE